MAQTWQQVGTLTWSQLGAQSSNPSPPSTTYGGMQLQDMIQRVRWEIGEPSIQGQIGTQQGTWSDSQIIDYLNDGLQLMSRPARIQAPPYTINLVPGQYSYPMPSDCLEDGLRLIIWNTNGYAMEVKDVGLDRWSYLNAQQSATGFSVNTAEAVYAQWNNNILLWPIPANSGDTLTVYYYQKLPSLVNLTDTPVIPARFHIALVKYAVAQCQAAVNETQLQMVAMQEFQRLLAQFTMERSIESRDRPARVRLRE